MIDLSAYKGIIFDMDGTLIDSMGGHNKAWKTTCEHFSYPFDSEYIYSLGGVPTIQTVVMLNQKYGLDHPPELVADFKIKVRKAMDFTPQIIQDTMAVLEHYSSTMKIAVGTGADRAHAENLLALHGILPKLNALATSCDVKEGKPAPDTFLLAASLMGLKAHECIVFEDTPIGQQAAASANMDCILVVGAKIQSKILPRP